MQWIDSLKKAAVVQKADTNKVFTLNAISDYYTMIAPDSAFRYAQEALSLSEKLNFDKGKFWAIVFTNKALYVLGNYALELNFAFKAFPLGQKLNDTYTIGWSNGTLGDCYFNLGQYSTALKYYREVQRVAEESSIIDLFSIYSAMVPVFIKLNKFDSALIYARRGYNLQRQNPLLNGNNQDGNNARSTVYRFLGEAFEANRIYDSSLYYYHLTISYSEAARMGPNTIDANNGIADVYRKTGMTDSSVWYAQKAISHELSKKYAVSYLKAANILADDYQQKQLPDSTLKFLRIAYSINDSLFNRDKTIAVQNVFFNEKEKRRALEVATSRLQERYVTYLLVASLLIFLLVGGLLIRNKRIRQMQVIRNNIADDLHDDIGSTLSSISIMSELAKQKSPQALPLLASIEESTISIQENMSDIVWTIKAENDRFENVLHRMQLFATEILHAKGIKLQFESDPSLLVSRLPMKQRKNFYLFFKEVINNAAKYSAAKNVSVNILKREQHVETVITDDGDGFDTSMVFNGNGMGSLRKRATELNAWFNITSQIGEGTTVQLKFKIT